jgi:predicted ATPase
LSQSNPVLMIFEDVHWCDPMSLEALGRTVDRLRTLAVLLIVTYRPEFEPPVAGSLAHHRHLAREQLPTGPGDHAIH